MVAAGEEAQPPAQGIQVDADDIGGLVRTSRGPEAGVWVIAETTALPTRFRKIVVTDDRGRFVVPDLPRNTRPFKLWVRGYGLVDSKPAEVMPGKVVTLEAIAAPTPQAAAEVYPAHYWLSLIKVPDASEFPGSGPDGNGIAPGMRVQADWISAMKDGCQLCHQLGNKATREIPSAFRDGHTSLEAWDRRVRAGQRGPQMSNALNRFGRARALAMFADWTDRIAGGEVPPQPPRPEGLERNLVLSQWEWGGPTSYVHDEVATDKRRPTVNANGRVYGVDFTMDSLLWVDPLEGRVGEIKLPILDPATPSYIPQAAEIPSAYFGTDVIWKNQSNPHNPMMDAKGRVWITSQFRPPANPAFCLAGSDNRFAKHFPLERSSRQATVYDPRTGNVAPVDTCFSTHHLQFAEDRDDTLYFSGDSNVIGWVNTAVWDKTQNATDAQGWCPMIVDVTGDGAIGPYTQPGQPLDPSKDMRIAGFPYGITVNPADGSIWWATTGVPGRIARMERGTSPPATCTTEVFEPPFDVKVSGAMSGFTPRGLDVDRNGVIWVGLSGGPHIASFDRRKCAGPLNGPTATGQHCREGWTMTPAPGPQMKGAVGSGSADFAYYNWVDQFDTLGLGANVPMMAGSGSDSLLALLPATRTWVTLRVPYPLGFYSRGLDGRIDDPAAGWKGRGVWADFGTNLVFHLEGGKGARSSLVKFQMRPNPLAR
jgi:hypothetical protein